MSAIFHYNSAREGTSAAGTVNGVMISVGLWQNFDGAHRGVTARRNKFEQQLSLGVGFKTADPANDWMVLTCELDQVQIAQDDLTIAENAEKAAALSGCIKIAIAIAVGGIEAALDKVKGG
jgi:hypothetical protein